MSDAGNSGFHLFKDMGQGTRSVHLDWFGSHAAKAVAEGFKIAADRVVESIQDDPRHPDMYFWPVVYLYRHAMELTLKELLRRGAFLVNVSLGEGDLHGHDLARLWSSTRSILLKAFPDAHSGELAPIDMAVTELHSVDPRGDAFRYRTNRKGHLHLEQLPRVLSLEHAADQMGEAFSLLDGISCAIEHFIELCTETERDARQ